MSTNTTSKPKDLFATLAEEKNFSKLNLSQAYQHVPLNEESCDNQHTPWAVSLHPAVLLSAYQYEIQFKPSTLYLYHTNQIGHQSDMTVISHETISKLCLLPSPQLVQPPRNKVLSKAIIHLKVGPDHANEVLKPYHK